MLWSGLNLDFLKVDPKVTKKHTINKEISALVYSGKSKIILFESQKLLGVTIDRKLNFNEHVTNLCDRLFFLCLIDKQKNSSTRKNFPIYTPNTKAAFNECLFYSSIWLLSFSLDEPQ